ncbi:MAG: DsbA family protein [Anaerolineales bacterium]|nr:DsbA family protein [Anaerolineales bacterium]
MPKHQETLSKRQVIKQERAKRQKRQRITTMLIVCGVAIVVIALMIFPSMTTGNKGPSSRPNADWNAMGDPNAPVIIEEYSDFQCPYCQMFSLRTEPSVVEDYVKTGKVYFVFYPYGPGGYYIGPESYDATKSAFCAGEQGKFWEYKDMLYSHLTGENVGDFVESNLMAFAEEIELDMTRFKTCYNENTYEDKMLEGINKGIEAEINGTPAFLINGKLIMGYLPYENFKKEIEAALAAVE